jgi:hypothetical protein
MLLGNGNGTFAAAQNFAVGTSPQSVTVADVNGDGQPDLIVANKYSNTVSVLLGNGDGTFQAAKNLAVGTNPFAVTPGDMNGDGHLDLIVANEGSNSVSVLFGNGNGTFKKARNLKTDALPRSVVAVDLNGDGHLDLVTANYSGSTESVILGNGNGTFKAAQNYFAGPRPEAVVAADLNGDGLPDLAVRGLFGAGIGALLGKPNAATHFLVTAPSSVTAGTPFTLTVTALTAGGQVDDLYTGTVHFSSSDMEAMLPADYKFTKADLGVHTFTVTLNTGGTQTVTATDKSHKTITGTATVTVNSSGTPSVRPPTGAAASNSPDIAAARGLPALVAEGGLSGGRLYPQVAVATAVATGRQALHTDIARMDSIADGTPAAPPPALGLDRRRGRGEGVGSLEAAVVDVFFADNPE